MSVIDCILKDSKCTTGRLALLNDAYMAQFDVGSTYCSVMSAGQARGLPTRDLVLSGEGNCLTRSAFNVKELNRRG